MKTFLLVPIGVQKPTKSVMNAWQAWFESVKDHIVDSGNPFGEVREVTRDGVRVSPRDEHALAGYIILKAKDMDEATRLVEGCPIVSSLRITEITI